MELRRALAQLARTPRLLVACDYDGTLAPIVPDPQRGRPATGVGDCAAIELSAVRSDKGAALDALRHQVGATAAVFLGDDVTDERAFAG